MGLDFGKFLPVALPVAAALLLALAIPAFWNPRETPVDDGIRGSEIQLLAPAGPVDQVSEFRWQSPIEATTFRISIYRADELIWSSTSNQPSLVLPAGLTLERGTEFTWEVQALDQSGSVRMQSPRQRFTLR